MEYYNIELSTRAKQICTIFFPWGEYKYQKLPIGVSNRPDILQENTSKLFEGFVMVHSYIYGVLVITKNKLIYHLKALKKVLHKRSESVLKANKEK